MLKLTSLALGLLTVISIAPASQAIPLDVSILAVQHPAGDRHSQVVLSVNPETRREPEHYQSRETGYRYRQEAERRRQLELAREREAQERLAAERRRRQQYAQRHGNSHGEYRDNHRESRDYQGEYRRNR